MLSLLDRQTRVARWLASESPWRNIGVSGRLVAARGELPKALEAFEREVRFEGRAIGGPGDRRADLLDAPDLAPLFLFHGDGRCRELALEMLPLRPLALPVLCGLMRRLNDWVAPVRAAALVALKRLEPVLKPEHIAPLVPRLAVDMLDWGRAETPVFETVFVELPAGREALISWLRNARQGPAARLMHRALAAPYLDGQLEKLALSAPHPHVRAVAAGALMAGEARWPDGRKRVWIDKSLGLSRMEPLIRSRPLTVSAQVEALLPHLAADRSARVRRLGADHVVSHGPGALGARDLALLEADGDPGVKTRLDYARRKWGGGV